MDASALAFLIAASGPLERSQIRIPVPPDAHPEVVDRLVSALAERARADARIADAGVVVEAGCSASACTVAVEGLAEAMPGARQALASVLSGPPPRFGLAHRVAFQRAWRTRAQSPAAVLDAALLQALHHPGFRGRRSLGERERPRFRGPALREAWAALVAGASSPSPDPPAAGATLPGSLSSGPPAVLLVDWPGSTRAQVALAWPSAGGGPSLVRDALLAGDFESRLVQRLRESAALTYDVEADAGDGWAAAIFETSPESLTTALALAADEIAQVGAASGGAIQEAWLRLAGRRAFAIDSLAGTLSALPELPDEFPVSLPRTALAAVVVVADADRVDPRAAGWNVTHATRCAVVYGGPCP